MPLESYLEPFTGGLVTARDPQRLVEGELTQAEEALYEINATALRPVKGRETFNSISLSNPSGLAYLESTDIGDVFIAQDDSGYQWALVAETGTFDTVDLSASQTPAVSDKLDWAQLGLYLVLANGNDPMLAIRDPSSKTNTNVAGYNPITATPVLGSQVAGAGIWPSNWINKNGFWWITEYSTITGAESGFTGTPFRGPINAANEVLTFTSPTKQNPDSDKWRLYRGGPADLAPLFPLGVGVDDDPGNPFPDGYLVGEASFFVDIDDIGEEKYTTEYKFLEVNIAGVTQRFNRDGTRPIADILETFENSVVCNDVSTQSRIRYSYPDTPFSWPDFYFINFETKTKDVVTALARISHVLVVGLEQAIARVNYLPRETDAEFDRGRVYEILSTSHGIVGSKAYDTFTFDGGKPMLAFMDRTGMFMTDGFSILAIAPDIDWPELVEPDYVAQTVVRDIPHLKVLGVFYTPKGETANSKAVYLHYHSSQRKEGGFKVTGPITVEAIDAVYARGGTLPTPTLFTVPTSGQIQLEDRDPVPLPMKVRSRQMISGGQLSGEVNVKRLFVRHRGATGTSLAQWFDQPVGADLRSTPAREFETPYDGVSQVDLQRYLVGPSLLAIETKAPLEFWQADIETSRV